MYRIEEFAQETASIIAEKLGGGCKVKTLAVEKINTGKLYSLVIVNGKYNVSPNFYLGGFYNRYTTGEYTVSETAESIIREYNKMEGLIKEDSILAAHLSEKEWVKERLFLQLINRDRNKNFLDDAVHSDYAGLSLVLYVLVKEDAGGTAKVKVTKNMCRHFGWDEEDTINYALENTMKLFPVELCPLERMLSSFLNIAGVDMQAAGSGIPCLGEDLVILTNRKNLYGASALFYPGVLNGFAERKGTSLFLIPSSIHEFIIIPDNGLYNPADLENMLREVNGTEVALDEVLSDNLYYYNYVSRELSVLNAENTGTAVL